MATFIKLHEAFGDGSTREIRVCLGHGDDYFAADGGTWIARTSGGLQVTETPAEIDALLGVTESGEAIAAALEAEAARMDDDATAIHNGTMRGDMKLRAKAFRDAAKIARAARGER